MAAQIIRRSSSRKRFDEGRKCASPKQVSGLDKRELVRRSGLFDETFYLSQRDPDEPLPADPLSEYVSKGVDLNRDPHPDFKHSWYLQRYPDVARSGVNPLVHYLRTGAANGFNPGPDFDTKWYIGNTPETNPLAHYVRYRTTEAREINCPHITDSINKKWEKDIDELPLTPDHYVLYDLIHRRYLQRLGEFPNLVQCRDFNDRMQWLKLFDQKRDLIICADKVLVQNYIKERIGSRYTAHQYQVHDEFDQIDFQKLPSAFVIKANHDAGSTIIVRDKLSFKIEVAERRIKKALSRTFGWEGGEWHYRYIERKVLVEQFIGSEIITSPPDFKFYCVHGKVKFMHYIYNRDISPKEQVIDDEGNDIGIPLYTPFLYGTDFQRPKVWDELIDVAEKLSKGFKFVRVDLFCIEDNIVAGEMSFHPGSGYYLGDGQRRLGQLLDFDRTTVEPFILPELDREARDRRRLER